MLQFATIIKSELDRSGHGLALIARSGLDLGRFGVRYSHAGLSLKSSRNTAWSVRQLYFACEENRPRIFDQGLSGFLLGTSDPDIGYVSIVLLPQQASDELERAALDDRQALQLLGESYSANAYPYAERYQNCNQWVMELIAAAWGRLTGRPFAGDAPAAAVATADTRPQGLRALAQRWLNERGYTPSVFETGSRALMWLATAIPWVHADDHPEPDRQRAIYRVSMPASIEAFVQANVPDATRIEMCHTERHVVIRRGWQMIAEGCVPADGDTVIALD